MKPNHVVPASRGRRARVFVLAVAGCIVLGPSCVDAEDAVTLGRVLNAWRNREHRVMGFRFQWVEDHLQAKGSVKLPPDPKYKGLVFPPRDTAFRVESSCEIDRDMMRYSFRGESLQVYNDGALEQREYVSASDGDISKAFWPIPNKLRRYPKGVIFDEKFCADAGTLEVKPLFWIYRALNPALAFSEKSLWLSPSSGVIDGRTCAIVGCRMGATEYAIWTDRTRDFVPLRLTIGSAITGKLTTQADITYQRDLSHGWTPVGWRIAQPTSEDPQHCIVARVTKTAINLGIPKSRFQIEFPPGTVVIDMRNNSERYLVGPDGSKQNPPDGGAN
jgi:hypothetical protein